MIPEPEDERDARTLEHAAFVLARRTRRPRRMRVMVRVLVEVAGKIRMGKLPVMDPDLKTWGN